MKTSKCLKKGNLNVDLGSVLVLKIYDGASGRVERY